MPLQAAGREWSQSSHPGNLTPEDKLLPSQSTSSGGSPSHLKCGHSSSVRQRVLPRGDNLLQEELKPQVEDPSSAIRGAWATPRSQASCTSGQETCGYGTFSPPCIPGRALLVGEEAESQEVMDFLGEDVGRDRPSHSQEKNWSWPHAGTRSIGELAPASTPLHLPTPSFLHLLLTHYLGPEPLVRQSVMGWRGHPRARCVAELWLWAERGAMEAPLASQHSFQPPELPHGHCPSSPLQLLPV